MDYNTSTPDVQIDATLEQGILHQSQSTAHDSKMVPCLACISRRMSSIASASATAARWYSAVPKPPRTNVHDGLASEPKPRARSSRRAEAGDGRSSNSDQSTSGSRIPSFGLRKDTETASSSKSSWNSGRAARGKGNERASERQGQGTSSFGLKKETITESTSDRQPSTTSTSSSGWTVCHKRNHRYNNETQRGSNRLYPSPHPSIPSRDGSRRRPPPLDSGYVTEDMLSSVKNKESPILDFANLPRHPSPKSQVRPSV